MTRISIVLNGAMEIPLKRHGVILLFGMITILSTALVLPVRRPHAFRYRATALDSGGDSAATLLVGSGSAPGCTEGIRRSFEARGRGCTEMLREGAPRWARTGAFVTPGWSLTLALKRAGGGLSPVNRGASALCCFCIENCTRSAPT